MAVAGDYFVGKKKVFTFTDLLTSIKSFCGIGNVFDLIPDKYYYTSESYFRASLGGSKPFCRNLQEDVIKDDFGIELYHTITTKIHNSSFLRQKSFSEIVKVENSIYQGFINLHSCLSNEINERGKDKKGINVDLHFLDQILYIIEHLSKAAYSISIRRASIDPIDSDIIAKQNSFMHNTLIAIFHLGVAYFVRNGTPFDIPVNITGRLREIAEMGNLFPDVHIDSFKLLNLHHSISSLK